MPVNKAAQFRLDIIDECLRNATKKWSKNEILKYLNRKLECHYGPGNMISISQLRYDIEHMQSEYGAPIELYREGRGYYYKYEEPDFSIKNIPVKDDDFIKLHTAVDVLQQLKGFTIAEQIAEVVSRIEHRYNHTTTYKQQNLIFDNTPYMSGIENLEDIYHAITHKVVLKIKYCPFQSTEAKTYVTHPYLLKEYKHRWYLFGLNNEKKKIATYALDRIQDMRVTNVEYIENNLLDPEKYFEHIIGVTKPKSAIAEDIHLMVSPKFAPYVISQPLHSTQQVLERMKDGHLYISLKLIINPELISLILSFGKDLMVLTPQTLCLEVQSTALMLLCNYG